MRAPGMTMHKLPLFVWAVFLTAILLILSLPVFAGSVIVPAKNSAICWKLLFLRQSAGNFISFNFWRIPRDFMPKIFTFSTFINNNQLGPYLTGLIEGDGYFFVPDYPNKRDNKNRLIYPSLQISCHSKDLPLFIMLQKIIGHGSICKKPGKAYVYTINNKEGLLYLISIINGYFRTPKINSLHKLINYYNKLDYNITLLPLDNSPISSNSWLSGFIDADGCFTVRYTPGNYTRIGCQFEISQRQFDISGESLYNIMENIAIFLKSFVKETKKNTSNPQFRVRSSSLSSNKLLIAYLTKYPLFSSKYLDYIDWYNIVQMMEKGEHLTKNGKLTIKLLKSKMNNNRIDFNWDHLNKRLR